MLLHFPKSANLSVQTASRMVATPQAASSAATLRHLTAPHCARFLHDLPGTGGSGLDEGTSGRNSQEFCLERFGLGNTLNVS